MPDRYGNPDKPPCPDPRCGTGGRRPGWVDEDDEGRPVPCLLCKGHLIKGTVHDNDFAESTPSARAQQAIERENNR